MESGSRSCSLLLLLSVATLMMDTARGYDIYVGGRSGWVTTPSESYGSWSGRLRFSVNDSLVFVYDKSVDSVLQVTSADYTTCSAANPIATLNTGRDSFKLTRSGPFYFITGNATHCQAGQKLLVVVLAIRSPPSSSTTPAPPTGSTSAPAPAPGTAAAPPTAPAPGSTTAPTKPAPAPASTAPVSAPTASTPSPAPASPTPSSGPTLAPSSASSPSPPTGGSSGSSPPSESAPVSGGSTGSSPPSPPTRSAATSRSVPTILLAAALALLAGPSLH